MSPSLDAIEYGLLGLEGGADPLGADVDVLNIDSSNFSS